MPGKAVRGRLAVGRQNARRLSLWGLLPLYEMELRKVDWMNSAC